MSHTLQGWHDQTERSLSRQSQYSSLIILPILDIYRKYYGWRVMGYILLTFYLTMAAAGYVVEFLFQALGIIPQDRHVAAITEGV